MTRKATFCDICGEVIKAAEVITNPSFMSEILGTTADDAAPKIYMYMSTCNGSGLDICHECRDQIQNLIYELGKKKHIKDVLFRKVED